MSFFFWFWGRVYQIYCNDNYKDFMDQEWNEKTLEWVNKPNGVCLFFVPFQTTPVCSCSIWRLIFLVPINPNFAANAIHIQEIQSNFLSHT